MAAIVDEFDFYLRVFRWLISTDTKIVGSIGRNNKSVFDGILYPVRTSNKR